MLGTNTLVYYENPYITAVKSFIVQARGDQFRKHYYGRNSHIVRNKLVCLPLAGLCISLVFIIMAGTYLLGAPHHGRLSMEKRYSLLIFKNYDRKNFITLLQEIKMSFSTSFPLPVTISINMNILLLLESHNPELKIVSSCAHICSGVEHSTHNFKGEDSNPNTVTG